MAYTFNRTLNLLNGGDEKQNIFRSEDGGQAPQNGTGSTGNIKTSVEGAVSTQPKSTGAGAQQALQRSSLVAPKSAVLKANVGKVQAPKATEEALGGIREAGANLQSEADKYVSDASKTANLSEDVLNKAVTGDVTASKDVTGLLGKNILQTEQFKPQTDIQIEQAGELSTPAGIQRTLAREADPEYTRGMGALDLSILGQSPDFAQTMEAIQRGQGELYSQADKSTKEATDKRLKAEQESLAGAQGTARDWLTGKSTTITDEAKTKEKAYDNQLAYYRGDYNPTPEEKAAWDQELNDYIATQQAESYKQLSPYKSFDYGQYITPELAGTVDPREYLNYISPDDTDYTQFLAQDQANQFNNIMALLGQGENVTAGYAPKSMFGIDQGGYNQAMLDKAIEMKGLMDEYPGWEAEAPGRPMGEPQPPQANTPIETFAPGALEDSIPEDYVDPLASQYTQDPNMFPGIGTLMFDENTGDENVPSAMRQNAQGNATSTKRRI